MPGNQTPSNFSLGVLPLNTSGLPSLVVCFQDDPGARVFAYILILLVSFLGNSLVVRVIVTGDLAKKKAHLFLLNMAVADLVITLVYLPRMVVMVIYGNIWLVTGKFGLALCRLIPFLHHLCILVSVFTILAATVDRFCAIVFPLRNFITQETAKVIVVLTWVFAAGLRWPYLVTPVLLRAGVSIQCTTRFERLFGEGARVYYDFLFWLYCTCLLIIVMLYTITIIRLKTSKHIGASNDNDCQQARKQKASEKLLKLFIAVTICFISCWFLYFFADLLFDRPFSCDVIICRLALAHSFSALNPCIIILMNEHYRDGCQAFFKRCSRSSRSVQSSSD